MKLSSVCSLKILVHGIYAVHVHGQLCRRHYIRKLFPSCDAMTNMASFPVRKLIYCTVKRGWISRNRVAIIRLITPLPVTWNEAIRPWGPWKHSLPKNLILLFLIIPKNDFFRVESEIFKCRLIFCNFSGENILDI